MTAGELARRSGREVWWWLSGAARLWWGHRWQATGYLGLCAGLEYLAAYLLLVATVAPLVVLSAWCRVAPVSYGRLIAGPVWRRQVRRQLRRSWPVMMEAVGLARRTPATGLPRPGQPVTPLDRVGVPVLHRLRWRDGQLVASPRLLVGQTVEDVATAADRLRVALNASRCRVLPNPANTACWIVWSFGDPLAAPFPATVPVLGAVSPDLRRLPMGRTEDGDPWLLDARVSTLVAGTSGSGKASLVWSLLFALAPAIRAGLVEVHGIDLKGGMEFAMGRALFTRYAQTADTAVVLLEDAAHQMTARAQRMAGVTRSLGEPTAVDPLVFVVVDELAALIAYQTDRDLLRRAEAALSLLLSQGRAVGVQVFGFLQDPRKETVKMRHLFPQSFGLRLRDREDVAMVLSDGAVAAGAACHLIPRSTPGVGYVLGEDNRPVRVRAGHVTDPMITTCAARFPATPPDPSRSPPPTTGRVPAASQPPVLNLDLDPHDPHHGRPGRDRGGGVMASRVLPCYRPVGAVPPVGLRASVGAAVCADQDGDWFTERRGARLAAAKLVCAGCPVQQACLAYALYEGEPYGVWGGLDPEERRALVTQLTSVPTSPTAGTPRAA